MKQKVYSSEGFVLQRKNYQEADRIITVFSKDYGKIILIAKGVRKLGSKKRGHIENFSKIKFTASNSNGFDILTEAESIDSLNEIRNNLNKVSLAYYFCEVVNKIIREDERIINVYNLFSDTLTSLKSAEDLKQLRKVFINNLLVEMGYWAVDKQMLDPDIELEKVLERKINSLRVGKKVLG